MFKLLQITVALLLASSVKCQSGVDCFHKKHNSPGVCIGLKHCDSAVKELIELKKNNRNTIPQTCRFEDSYPIVCCPLNSPVSSVSKAEQKCKEYQNKYMNVIGDTRSPQIVDGKNASLGEFPHMAALGYEDGFEIKWLCGGALISEKFVLTAAHCKSSSNYGQVKYVQLGDIKLKGISSTAKIYRVSRIYGHPNYVAPSTYNDVTLLELEKPAEISAFIKPACLFTNPDDEEMKKFQMQVTGFGLTEYGGSQSEFLQKVDLQYFDNCKSYYKVDRRKLAQGINEDMQLCFGSKADSKDACSGDSGGPLQYFDFSVFLYRVVGLVSFGSGCGTPGFPSIYTRVSNYVSWIESIAWP